MHCGRGQFTCDLRTGLTAFKRADLKDNPQGIAKVVSDMAEETNRILADNGLLAK